MLKIISGGQTGADREGLDAAIVMGLPHGGWCTKFRRAEDGPIPASYNLIELDNPSYPARTKRNVQACNIAIVWFTRYSAGTNLTERYCIENKKPYILVDLSRPTPYVDFNGVELCQSTYADYRDPIASTIGRMHDKAGNLVINVAGNRESVSPGIYNHVYKDLMYVFGVLIK